MPRYELAIVKRALKLILAAGGQWRLRLTADRGLADVALFDLLCSLRVRFVIRVESYTKIWDPDQPLGAVLQRPGA